MVLLILINDREYVAIFFITECEKGWYGDNCRHQCKRYCKDGTTCNHVNGQCDAGCNAGWTGPFCDKGSIRSWFFLNSNHLNICTSYLRNN